ncbi:hypothetical protein PybrP1_003957 [[Pythium] brassicae (nom. inval.)]|nr:hypothetical protein PybrP1_003957 [[Pythium] brassicae (nom. inval.)]
MAMALLPSFQSFLETTAQGQRPVSPLALQQQEQQAPLRLFASQQTLFPSPTSGLAHSPLRFTPPPQHHWPHSISNTSSEDDDEDDDDDDDNELLLLRRLRPCDDHQLQRLRHRATSPIARRLMAAVATGGGEHSPASKRVKKKYLKERERCEIVRRVRAGEKQAHLAKEFGVSRAAVCYLLKHQTEILSRSAERL